MRTMVIGDIHGAARALEQVLERSGFDPKVDRLIQLGDVADGWSETSECVDILLDIKKKSTEENEPVFIRGNHDVWVYDWMMYGIQPIIWTQQGGQATLGSYIRTGKLVDRHHKNFWFKQDDYYIDDQNRLFIHAGWDYTVDVGDCETELEKFTKQAKTRVNAGSIAQECHWDRKLLAGAKSGRHNGFKPLRLFNEVYIGHTAIRAKWHGQEPQPENYLNLWNLDTGAGWYGCLTIMDIDTKEIWQSDNVRKLYPDELGR